MLSHEQFATKRKKALSHFIEALNAMLVPAQNEAEELCSIGKLENIH